MLRGIAILALLTLPGSFIVLGLACLHPGVRAKATALIGLRPDHGMHIGSRLLQRHVGINRGR
jgi:hypothetical protein